MKKAVLFLLCLSLLLSCCACGSEKETQALRDNSEDVAYGGSLSGDMDGGRYFERETLKAPELGVYFTDAVELADGRLILRGEKGEENKFFALSLDSLEFTPLELDISGRYCSMCAADGGELYILCCEEDGSFTVSATDSEFAFNEEFTITGMPESCWHPSVFYANGELLLYVDAIDSYVCRVSSDGSMGNTIVSDMLAGQITKVGDTALIISQTSVSNQITVFALDEANNVAETYEFESTAGIMSGSRSGAAFFRDSSIIYQGDHKTGEYVPYCNAKLSGCAANAFIYIDDDSFFSIQNGQPTLWRASELEGVTIVTLAAYRGFAGMMRLDIANAVKKFNERSADIKIVYIDYADYDTDTEALGMTHLLADILSGSCPDIFELSGLPAKLYTYKGMFENLRPFIDASENISYDALLPSAAQCMYDRGELCYIIPAFNIRTYFADGAYLQGAASWEDMFAIAGERGAYDTTGGSPEQLMRDVLAYNGDKFIDYDNASCNFESAEFVRLLEYAAQLPQDALDVISSGRTYSGKQVFCSAENDPVNALSEMHGVFHGNYVNCGFPESGSVAKMLPAARFAMSSASAHKQEAWAFLEYLLSNEFLNENTVVRGQVCDWMFEVQGIPAVEEYIDVRLENQIDQPLRHPGFALFASDGEDFIDIPIDHTDENTKADAWQLLRGMDGIYEYDSAILDIIMGEAAAMFNGDKSAAEVARLIQSKASIYLAEQFA